jgi:hypothetical protein
MGIKKVWQKGISARFEAGTEKNAYSRDSIITNKTGRELKARHPRMPVRRSF